MYVYSKLKPNILTDNGQRMFLIVRDFVHKQLHIGGAVRMQEAMSAAVSGDSWDRAACVGRLVELGEIREVTQPGNVATQHRVFVSARA